MPVLDESAYNIKRAGSSLVNISNEKPNQSTFGSSIKLPNGVPKQTSAPLVDLLDLNSDDIPQPNSSTGDFLHDLLGMDLTASSSSGLSSATSGGADILLDLLSIGSPSIQNDGLVPNHISSKQDNTQSIAALDRLTISSPSSSSLPSQESVSHHVQETPQKVKLPLGRAAVIDLLDGFASNAQVSKENPSYPSITAFQSSSLKVTFNFSKLPEKPQVTTIQASFTNLSSNDYSDFLFQAAVPKFIQLHLDPASSNTLPANGSGTVTQSLSLTNSQHGQKALAMRMRIAYKVNNQDMMEQGQISNFPPGL